jgi:hypothetical protein
VAPVSGYIQVAVRKWVFFTTAANYLTPTSAELSAGKELSGAIASQAGWSGQGATVDLPNAQSRWTPKVPGMISAADSSLTFNMDKTSSDLRTVFDDGSSGSVPTSGYMAIAYEGLVTGGKMKVFPVTVTSVATSDDVTAAAQLTVMYAITQPPSGFIAVPTA